MPATRQSYYKRHVPSQLGVKVLDSFQWILANYRDEYVVQQLRVESLAASSQRRADFLAANTQRRIELLEEFRRSSSGVPIEIARLAVEESDSRVRAWCAEHLMRDLEPTLRDRLIADTDPLVHAKGIEGGFGAYTKRTGPSDTDWSWEEFPWQTATELERLAYLRSLGVHHNNFIEKLFDPENHDLGLELHERRRYAIAFLAGKHVEGRFPLNILKFMPMWPTAAGIQAYVYRHCLASDIFRPAIEYLDEVIYEHCEVPVWRAYLLKNFSLRSVYGDVSKIEESAPSARLTQLALSDSDDRVRELAHMFLLSDEARQKAVDEAIRTQDHANLKGLWQNERLTIEEFKKLSPLCSAELKWLRPQKFDSYDIALKTTTESVLARHKINPASWRRDKQEELKKLDRVLNSSGTVLAVLDDGFFELYVGMTLGLLLGAAIYLFSRDLVWTILAVTGGTWAWLSWMIYNWHKFRLRRLDYVYLSRVSDYWMPLPQVDIGDKWNKTIKKLFDVSPYEEIEDWGRFNKLIEQIRKESEGIISADTGQTLSLMRQDRERIKRYKVALAEVEAREAAREAAAAYEAEREEEREAALKEAEYEREAQEEYAERREEILKRREETRNKRQSKRQL